MHSTETTTRTRVPGRAALTTTRVLAGALAVLILIQGALAGSHLVGDGTALDAHRMLGTQVLTILGLVTVVTAAVAFRRNRWVLPSSIVALFGLGAQIGMGFQDRLDVHLPLGLALFGIYLGMALVARDRQPTNEQEN